MANSWQSLFELGKGYEYIISFEVCGYSYFPFFGRFYFKRSTEDGDCEVVYEEVKDDSVVLPTFDGKVVGKVERVNS